MDLLCEKAIQQALLTLERNDHESWCRPMVDALESRCDGSAASWCIEIISRVFGPFATDDDGETLVELRRLTDSELGVEQLRQKAREIWYMRAERTALQTATSKLSEALAAYRSGDRQRYKRLIVFIASEIVTDGIVTTADTRVKHVVEAFKHQCERLKET